MRLVASSSSSKISST